MQKLNISLAFTTQPYFPVPKDARLNSTYYLVMKIFNKTELQNMAINHSVDVDYKGFMKIYRKFTSEPYSLLTIDTTLLVNNPFIFTKDLLDLL